MSIRAYLVQEDKKGKRKSLVHVLFRYCESPHVRPANAFAYGIRSAVVGIHRCHVLCKIRLPVMVVVVVVVVVVVANGKTISRKGGQSKTHKKK